MRSLKQLEPCCHLPRLDYLNHTLIESCVLRRFFERDGLKDVTSNPSIFEEAIAQNALKQFQAPRLKDFSSGRIKGNEPEPRPAGSQGHSAVQNAAE